MNFFKQAQDFAASANTNTDGDNTTAPAGSDGGFGSFMSTASNLLKSQGGAPAGDGSAAPPADGTLPGGRTAPTDQELLQSGQVLFGAARGQQVDPTQLAGAASDLLGGLAAHGNIDQGTYGTYINQAEDYLNKYAGQGQSGGQSAAGAGAGAGTAPAGVGSQDPAASQAPPTNDVSDVPASSTDQSDGSSPADQTAYSDSAPGNAASTDDYSPDQQQGGSGPSSGSAYGNNQY